MRNRLRTLLILMATLLLSAPIVVMAWLSDMFTKSVYMTGLAVYLVVDGALGTILLIVFAIAAVLRWISRSRSS